jgi:hypothetical protein
VDLTDLKKLKSALDFIQSIVKNNKHRFTLHSLERIIERDIQPNEVREAILNGEIIENYPEDKFGHSCLIFGKSNQKILHVQCSVNPVWIITAYDPTSMADKWEVGYKKRKKT